MADEISAYLPLLVALGLGLIGGLVYLLPVIRPGKSPEQDSAADDDLDDDFGLSAISDARLTFDARFFVAAVLVLMVTLAITFLLPWALTIEEASSAGFWSGLVFLGVVVAGLVYAWKKGALDWN